MAVDGAGADLAADFFGRVLIRQDKADFRGAGKGFNPRIG